MRKVSILIMIFAMFAFVLGACNTGTPKFIDGGDDSTDVLFVWGTIDEMSEELIITAGDTNLDLTEDSGNYPGRELNLAEAQIYTWDKEAAQGSGMWVKEALLGGIQNYGEIILYAELFDKNDNKLIEGTSIAQFSLLKEGASGWDDANKLAEKHNLVSSVLEPAEEGDFEIYTPAGTAAPSSGASGIPGKLLVQGSYNQEDKTDDSVTTVHVIALHLKVSGDRPVFEHIYGSETSATGNKITFTDSAYNHDQGGAVLFKFPDKWNTSNDWHNSLKGKKMVFNFTVEPPSSANPSNANEYQIHIQACDGTIQEVFNGGNPPSGEGNEEKGQKYITLNDNPEDGGGKYLQSWDATTNSGSFTIAFNALITAATETTSDQHNHAPFILQGIRICNNGTEWTDAGVTHIRHKTYSVIFTSITVED